MELRDAYQRYTFNRPTFNTGSMNMGMSQMGYGLQLMNLAEDPYFAVSKEVYDNQKARIAEEYKLRKEWITGYSDEKALDK